MEMLSLLHNDPLFPSVMPETEDLVNWSLAEVDSIMFDMPTPPVSPSHADQQQQPAQYQAHHHQQQQEATKSGDPLVNQTEDELDLGLGDLLSNMDLPEEALFDSNDWFTDDNLLATLTESSPMDILSTVADAKCEVSELRHDCMWAGHCPAEEHRYGCKKELPSLLSSSPSETVLSMSSVPPVVVTRTRLDTLGSIRPETPLSPSDSEMDALTSDECNKSESSSSEDSESENEDQPNRANQSNLPPNIYPVRSARKHQLGSKLMRASSNIMPTMTSIIPDHSYSHSDHSYHTQRRPASSSSNENGADCLLTPSDSEEEIDVVSLGELCRMTPSANSKTTVSAATSTPAVAPVAQLVNTNGGPIRLKLKVPPAGTVTSSQVLVRKALPSHPSAAVRQQLQLQLANAAQQRKFSSEQSSPIGSTATSTVKKAIATSASSAEATSTKRSHGTGKRPRNSDGASPRKRCSRTASDSEDSCEKRSQHNSMERQRRVDLRNAFEFLRSLIPDLESTDRAAKVVILKKAALFCQGLTQREKQHVAEKDTLQKRQEMLRKRLAALQRRR